MPAAVSTGTRSSFCASCVTRDISQGRCTVHDKAHVCIHKVGALAADLRDCAHVCIQRVRCTAVAICMTELVFALMHLTAQLPKYRTCRRLPFRILYRSKRSKALIAVSVHSNVKTAQW